MRFSRIVTLTLLPALVGGGVVVSAAAQTPQPVQARPGDPAPATPPALKDDDGPLPTPDIKRGRDAAPPAPPAPKAPENAPKREAQPAPKAVPKAAQPGADKITKGLAVAQPKTAKEREKALSDLYAHLAAAEDEVKAKTISRSIERLWLSSGSDTVNLLMQRAMEASHAKNNELALKLLDAAVELAPDYAEAWNRRAYVFYVENNIERSLGDLRRVLALDPNHFKALEGLANILKDIGRKKEALRAARQLYEVNPFTDGAKQLVDELAREVEGRGI